MKFHSLISEDGGLTISLGRLSFWIALGMSCYFWFFTTTPYPESLLTFLTYVMAYNLGKKFADAWRHRPAKKTYVVQEQDKYSNKYGEEIER